MVNKYSGGGRGNPAMKVGIVGLGLIGGSLARAIKAKTGHTVAACDRDPDVLSRALADGSADEALTEELSGLDMLLVALYPAAAVRWLSARAEKLPEGCVVVDMCGVKRAVCGPLEPVFKRCAAVYIGGHPMAGRESSGYGSALPSLFDGASMILTPFADTPPAALEAASAFFLSLGFGRITLTTPDRHDEIIAYTSQLAHVVSSAYVQSPTAESEMGFSAGSFRDLTRVAKLNEEMWAGLFLDNAGALTEQIDIIIENLREYRRLIAAADRAGLEAKLRTGRLIKTKLGGE